MQEQKEHLIGQEEAMACFKYFEMALGGDTNTIRAAEEGLLNLSKNPQFMRILLNVPLIQGISPNMAKLAVNYTRTYIRNLQAGQKHSTLVATAYYMIEQVSMPQLNFPLKQELSQSLIFLLQTEKNRSVVLSCEQKLLQLLSTATTCDDPNQINFQFIALFSYIVIQSMPMPLINHSQFLMRSFSHLVKISTQQAIQGAQETIEFIFQLLNIYLDTINKYLRKLKMLGADIIPIVNCNDVTGMINGALGLTLPSNLYSYPLFYGPKQGTAGSLVEKYHKGKQKTVQIINQCLAILLQLGKDSDRKNLELMKLGKQFITIFISAMGEFFNQCNYYDITSLTILDLISQIYRYLGIMLNSCQHYSVFLSAKTMLLFGVVFKTLMFSPQDYANFYSHPDEFVNSLYQIADYDTEKQAKKQKPKEAEKDIDQEQVEIQIFETVKTLSAKLLIFYTSLIDGSLPELVMVALSILDSNTVQTKYRKQQFLLILCIVRNNLICMQNLKFKIAQVLVLSLRMRQPPLKTSKSMEQTNHLNVEYGLLLAAIDCYLPFMVQYADLVCQSLLVVIESLLINHQVQDTVKLLALGLLNRLARIQQPNLNCVQVIRLLCRTLEPKLVNVRSLDCLQTVIRQLMHKYAGEEQFGNQQIMVEEQANEEKSQSQKLLEIIKIGRGVSELLQNEQISQGKKIIVDKLWNILIEIASNIHYMPELVPQLRGVLRTLFQVRNSNGTPRIDKLSQCMCNIIKHSLTISDLEQQYVEYVHQQFYKGEAKCSLIEHYHLLQHIIFYGATHFTNQHPNSIDGGNDNKMIGLILQMCIVSARQGNVDGIPRGQSQRCEGILLMQSLIIAMGKLFTKDMWAAALDCLCAKYKEDTTYDFMKAQLVTNLVLVIVFAYNYFDHSLIYQLLQGLTKHSIYFTYKNSSKLYTIGLIELLPLTNVPFVQQLYSQILDSIIVMLKLIQLGKDNQLELQEPDSEQEYYYRLKEMTKNCFTQLDEFYLFNTELEKVKTTNHQLLEQALKNLTENNQRFLTEVLKVRKIGNSTRVIYKLKQK